MRKITVVVVLLIIIGIAGYFIFSLDTRIKNNKSSNGISAIPYNSIAILRVNNPIEKWSGLLNMTYGRQLSLIPEVKQLNNQIHTIEEVVHKNKVLKACYEEGGIYFSMHMTGIKSYNFLVVANCNETDKTAFIDAISSALKSTNKNTRIYEECELNTLFYDDNSLSVAFENNLAILSSSPILLENSILQLKRRIPLDEKNEFAKLFKTADEGLDANLFINYKELSSFFNVFTIKDEDKNPSYFGDWMEVDLKIDDKGLLFNGFSLLKDSSASFLSNLEGLTAGKMNVSSVIPDNIAFMSYLGFDDYKKYHQNFKIHLQQKQELYQFEKNITTINKNNKINIEEDLYSWIGKEFCFFLTQGEHEDPTQNACVAIHAKNVEKAIESLSKIAASTGNKQDTASFMNYPIYNLGLVNFLPLTLGDYFKGVKHTNYVILQDYIVFGNDVGNLKNVINSYLRGKTLIKNIDFNQFYENFNDQSSYFAYLNPKKAKNFWSYFLNENLAKILNDNQEVLNDFEALGFQSISNDNLFYTNLYSNYKQIKNEEAVSLIECVLDTSYSRKPWIVKNHYTQENEILLQDDRNTLYLINNVGKILWKKKLPAAIVGEVHLIDRYKNDKYQYLFGTGKQLQLLDRNGNTVDGFPVKLKETQTQDIAALDYDKNRNYRILVPCGKKVFNYSAEGKIVKGWEFKGAKSRISSSPKLLQTGKKDYIIFSDFSGNSYVLDRRGENRIEINSSLPPSRENYEILIQSGLKNSGIVTTDTNGTVFFLKLSDELETITTRAFTKNHQFKLANLSSDNIPEVLYYDEGEIYAYKLSKNNLLKIDDLDFTPSFGVNSALLDNKGTFIITATDKNANEIHAYDPKGNKIDNFPMEGCSDVLITDLNKDGHKEMIIGNKAGSLFIYSIF